MKKLFKQILSFLVVSGTGWIIDFGIFVLLTKQLNFDLAYANMISCIPALTFVFLLSTRKVFENKKSGISLKAKYIIYFAYQIILIFCISWVGQLLYNALLITDIVQIKFIADNLKLFCKIIITPITMTANFFVMKFLTEKV